MSSSKSLPLFLTALFALMLSACAAMPTPPTPAEQEAVDARNTRYAQAKAVFDERCKTAGMKIYRTVENVEGVFLVDAKLGDSRSSYAHQKDPNWADAGLPQEPEGGGIGGGYIYTLLAWEHRSKPDQRGGISSKAQNRSGLPTFPGYTFVDAKDANGRLTRYTLGDGNTPQTVTYKQPLSGSPARYAISRTNHMDPADRALWVAGTTVTITDTQTNEVLATSTWYSFDPGQGNTTGYRSPWLFAQTCPKLEPWPERYPTRFFAEQVLKPKAH